jgi:hypothetical protein
MSVLLIVAAVFILIGVFAIRRFRQRRSPRWSESPAPIKKASTDEKLAEVFKDNSALSD